jgi:uncharacterized protein (TIGR03545 family)
VAVRIFRWRAVGPLLAFGAGLVVLWLLFADRIARTAVEDAGTSVLGARVEIGSLHLDLTGGRVELRALTVASPFEPYRNLLQADELTADLDLLPLLEKKVVIDRVAATGMRFGTARTTPGFEPDAAADSGVPSSRPGSPKAQAVRAEVAQFRRRFDVPVLQLATGRVEPAQLDPARLETARAADALGSRADSSARVWRGALDSLRVGPAVDSTQALLQRLRGARPTDLALVNDARRTLDQLGRTRDQLTTLERALTGGVGELRAGVQALDAARQRDYATARGLLKLPSLAPPDIGAALFGPVALGRFQQALYWTELARRYMPPGLLPREDAGPKRVRRAGTTVRFPRERAYPGFLLREGEISFRLGADSAPHDYAGRLTGLTSAPALYGRPTTFVASAPALRVGASLDHTRDVPRDTAAATLAGVRLPGFALPALPLALAPGAGDVTLSFALRGDSVRARWAVRAAAARWTRDTTAPPSDVARLVARVLDGITTLDVSAELRGTLAHPSLAVRSNLDDAVANGLRAAIGAEVAAAERRVRAEVDRLADEQVAPVRARVTALADEVTARVAEQRQQLETARRALEQRLRELTRLPGIRLP